MCAAWIVARFDVSARRSSVGGIRQANASSLGAPIFDAAPFPSPTASSLSRLDGHPATGPAGEAGLPSCDRTPIPDCEGLSRWLRGNPNASAAAKSPTTKSEVSMVQAVRDHWPDTRRSGVGCSCTNRSRRDGESVCCLRCAPIANFRLGVCAPVQTLSASPREARPETDSFPFQLAEILLDRPPPLFRSCAFLAG